MSRWLRHSTYLLAGLLTLPATPSLASTAEAWETFRRDVESSCREAVAETLEEPQIVVDPFGLQSYGLAFLTGRSAENGEPQSLVCIYDKVGKTVEIGGTMALESAVSSLRPPPPEPSDTPAPGTPSGLPERLLSPSALTAPAEMAALQGPDGQASSANPGALFAGRCDAQCAVTLDALSEADRAELLDLSSQIERTIAANAAASLGAGPSAARGVAGQAALAAQGETAETAVPGAEIVGSGSCTLYYFGYQNEAGRTVGTHQCRVTEGEGGALLVEKTSGERLRADIRPLLDGVSAFVGRTFQAGQGEQDYDAENPQNGEFGNTVGFAAEAEGQLMLISSQRRRFESSDSFFWVLALDRP